MNYGETTQSTMTEDELMRSVTSIIASMVKTGDGRDGRDGRNFDTLTDYLGKVLMRPYGMRILSRLVVKGSGVDDFARTKIKLAMPEQWWNYVESRLGRDAVTKLGGSKRKRVKKSRKRY